MAGMEEMSKVYDPTQLEEAMLNKWLASGSYARSEGTEDYTVVIPPPNVTGVLHLGHAVNDTIQDALVRKARMQKKSVRWIVGTDHAGIATQTKVDKKLASEGISRHEIGREKFLEHCQDWRKEYGGIIISQIKRIGSSCDFDHEEFTMSEEYAYAVRKAFVDWFNDGLIYKGKRIVNWCPSCTTAIADDEVEYKEEKGKLWYLRYPLVEPCEGKEYIIVATTRPETILGDTGVAVNPKDERYAQLVGKKLIVPIVNREIEIVADRHVDPEFGTGCVKLTPSHDPNDWAMGEAHGLERINVFDEHAKLIAPAPEEFIGLDRYEARKQIVERLEKLDLLEKIEEHDHSVGHCYRCDTTLEPWESEQWFVDVQKLKDRASEVVKNGSIKLYPERWAESYLNWMENLKDWCISRQLWWGHRIPVFYCDSCSWTGASMEDLDTCPECGAALRQDEDVLDTWFSSQLWPFATQGWPHDPSQLAGHYPTAVLSTAPDILNLWVARMVMSSLYFVGEIPFKEVYLHPTILAADGSRMSKSKGNGVNPFDLIDEYGADAMRFGLLSQLTGGQSVKFNKETMIAPARNFANKIWNASRFVFSNMEGYTPGAPAVIAPVDAWIFTRLAELAAELEQTSDNFRFADMCKALYSFFWNELCDWYIEFSKARLQGPDRLQVQRNLMYVLDVALRLLHPAMPFITEGIWQHMPQQDTASQLMDAAWPDASELASLAHEEAAHAVELMIALAGAVRSTRARYGISPKQELSVQVLCSADDAAALSSQSSELSALVKLSSFAASDATQKPDHCVVHFVDGLEIYVELDGLVDFEAEKERLAKQLANHEEDLKRMESMLNNEGFMSKASPEKIEANKARAEQNRQAISLLKAQIAELG